MNVEGVLYNIFTLIALNYSMDKQITSTLNQIEMGLSRSIKKLYQYYSLPIQTILKDKLKNVAIFLDVATKMIII